jgi:hypothetical protein
LLEYRAAEVGPGEIGVVEDHVRESRTGKIRPLASRAGEVGMAQIRGNENRFAEVGCP